MKTKMKPYLKTFAAVFIVFFGTLAAASFFLKPVSYTSVLFGAAGIVILYPAINSYIKWFDNLFGK